MLPKITIITPSYNQGQYLEQTIDSVLSQNYSNLEYIVIDGGSQDNSVEIIRKYEKYLAFWVSEKDKGQSDAINKGLRRATGEVINWLNSDDYYEKDTLQIVGEFFQNPQTNVLCGRSRIFYDESNQTSHFSSGTDIYKNNLAKTIGWARIDQPETFFRASAINAMGLLNPKFHYVMDKEWWIRYLFLFGLENIVEIDNVLVNFRLHGNSKTVSQQENFQKETNRIYAEIASILHLEESIFFEKPTSDTETILQGEFYQAIRKDLAQRALHYYWLYKADESYFLRRKNLVKKYIGIIHEDLLEEEDQQLLKKIKRRMYIPQWILDIFRFTKNIWS
jgi:glycosyltransferase involved in cell wall biosynthesis